MAIVKQTDIFTAWLLQLRDRGARNRIEVRIVRLREGNAGQTRSVGGGVSELKIDYGPGYRVYFTKRGLDLIILLCGGDKSSRSDDIVKAQRLARDWKEEDTGGS